MNKIQFSNYTKKHKSFIIRSSQDEDPESLSKDLRKEDVLEIKYYSGRDGITSLTNGHKHSKMCFTMTDLDGAVFAMFGVGWTANPRVGIVWLLSSDYLSKVNRDFLLNSQYYVDLMMQGHDVLFNHVHDFNAASVKWLRWLGFEATDHLPEVGSDKQPFTEYSKFSSREIKELYLKRDWQRYVDNTLVGLNKTV